MRLLIAVCLLAVASCSSIETFSDYDPEANFAALRTYTWSDAPPEAEREPLAYKRIVASVDNVLTSKSYELTGETADFQVATHFSVESKIRVVDWGYGPGYRSSYGYADRRDVDFVEYEQGTLVLDVIDANSDELIWRGSASGSIDRHVTPERRAERIQSAVEAIFAEFPPGTR